MYKNLFYFDIETVGKSKDLATLHDENPVEWKLFIDKHFRKKDYDKTWNKDVNEVYLEKSPLIAEFGKIVCFSYGIYKDDKFHVRSITGEENEILEEASKIFDRVRDTSKILSGFNIKGFDMPWLNKKYYKYSIKVPFVISVFNKKPWELNVMDLAEIWRSGSFDFPSMEEMINDLNIDNLNSIDGGQIHNKWYNGERHLVIDKCQNDVKMDFNAAEKILSNF